MKEKVEIMSVNENCITLKGVIPENDPLYEGKDPLNLLCWGVKNDMIGRHNVCIYYQIMRKLNANGEHTIEISYFLSYTGKYENSKCVPEDELIWKNEFSCRVSSLIEAFLMDFNRGQKCPLVKEPKRSLQPKSDVVERLERRK